MHAFYDTSLHLVDRSQSPPALTRIEVPRDLEANAHRDLGVFSPRSDWEIAGSTYPAGSLVVGDFAARSEEHTSELQSRGHLVCRLLLEKKKRMQNSDSLCRRVIDN